ncbi:hypothetical protein [Halomarina litorea]|uniref:hypothetical protein n=1 Tax=Halomarina litorea TaxID=2961595 RepID=UPI0020C2648A|nr:hypothetical protein [Halomarina sp. BCD28]
MVDSDYTEPLEGYTLSTYRALLADLQSAGFEFHAFSDAPTERSVFLRHDVDLSPGDALRMAELEAEMDVTSTYFFLLTNPLYNLLEREYRDVVARIESLGHEVGVHFSTHQYWSEQPEDATLESFVDRELSALSGVTGNDHPVISFHIPPEWVLDRTFDGFTHTYEPRFMTDILYRADSSHRWLDEAPFPDGFDDRMQVLTHPGIWGETHRSFERCVRDAGAHAKARIDTALEEQYLS